MLRNIKASKDNSTLVPFIPKQQLSLDNQFE